LKGLLVNQSILWHPFTQHGLGVAEIPVVRAEGAYLYTADGRAILDAISSWWVTTHGHCHPRIVKAVRDAAARLDQVIFAGLTHDLAQEMAERFLRLLAPRLPGLRHIFLSDSGSTAVEAALKMAIGYHAHSGTGRNRIIALEGGYHGDTFGAMSASARDAFTKHYEPYLFPVTHVDPFDVNMLEVTLKARDAAALIVEPLVQGAGGMRMYAPENLAAMAALCKRYGALLIADEVMTGWGRTGTLFACEQAGVQPDILCTSKGLTGGFIGMGATLATEEVYRAFYGTDRSTMFFHSSSFTGNPLACAAAAANMAIWEEESVLERIRAVSECHAAAAPRLSMQEKIYNIRQCGTILALDIGTEGGYLSALAPRLRAEFIKRDVLFRSLGNTVYVLPPYCTTAADLERCYAAITDVAHIVAA
jgi:adenosylmethionine-8-amino-7-oxononanoate aminotransferase